MRPAMGVTAAPGDGAGGTPRRSWRRWVAWAAIVVVIVTGTIGGGLAWRRWTTRADRAEALYDAAMAARALPMARDAIRKAAGIDENEPRYWLKLGRVQLSLGALQDALTAYERVLDFDPENVEALQNAAELSAAGGLFTEAKEHVAVLLKLLPDDARGQIVVIALAVRERRFAEAVRRVDELAARGIQTDDMVVLKSRALAGLRDDPGAVALLEARDRQTPGSVPILRELGNVYTRLGNKSGVNRTMARLAAIVPDNVEFQLAGARELAGQGRAADARARADAAQARAAADPDAQVKIVDYWLDIAGRAEALAAARRAAAGGGDAVKIAMAQKLLDLGAPAEALRLIAPFARPDAPVGADNVTPRTIYGNALFAGGRVAQAGKVADDVLRFDDTNIPGLLLRTRIGIAYRRYDQALIDAQMLVNGDPSSEAGLLALAKVQELRGERTLAGLSYGKAVKLFPDSLVALNANADWLMRTGRRRDAVLLARDFLRFHKTGPAMDAAIGICDRARDPCAAALRTAPRLPAAP